MTQHRPPKRRAIVRAPNWDGLDPPWRPDPTTDLREFVALAKFPFAALSPRSAPIHYKFFQRNLAHQIEVTPDDPALGLALVGDLDILVAVASHCAEASNGSLWAPCTLTLRANAILRMLGRSAGGARHELLHAALARLANTRVFTTLNTNPDLHCPDEFRLLESVDSTDARDGLVLGLSGWLRQHANANAFMKIDPAALRLRGLERRLYSWARAHLGAAGPSEWQITIPRAHYKAASINSRRKFRSALAQIAQRNRLPGFTVALTPDPEGEKLTLARRPPVAAMDAAAEKPDLDFSNSSITDADDT